ncbi:MAG: hypothetical protein AMS22_16085, partial [Thiotrichales bacterium SG8_50]
MTSIKTICDLLDTLRHTGFVLDYRGPNDMAVQRALEAVSETLDENKMLTTGDRLQVLSAILRNSGHSQDETVTSLHKS